VLDCGCGGSPLLPFLARYGCEAYGVDPGIGKPRPSLVTHYRTLFGRLIRKGSISLKRLVNREGEGSRSDSPKIVSKIKRVLRPANDAWYHDSRRIKRLGLDIKYFADSMENLRFESEYFDRVYSISVVEHLPEHVAYAGMKEMARVLKQGGLLVVTIDNDGPHVTAELRGKFQELIACTGLSLFGATDFSLPDASDVPGTYNVVGFVLEK
jgi:SAM-dependent methyltransferase